MKAAIAGMALLGALAGAFPTAVHAGSGVPGVVVGAGGGALLGQAIGRNTESTLVGAALGGVVGALADMEPRYDSRVYYGRPVQHQTVFIYDDDRHDDHRRHWRHKHHRHYRDHDDCRGAGPDRIVVIRDRGRDRGRGGWHGR